MSRTLLNVLYVDLCLPEFLLFFASTTHPDEFASVFHVSPITLPKDLYSPSFRIPPLLINSSCLSLSFNFPLCVLFKPLGHNLCFLIILETVFFIRLAALTLLFFFPFFHPSLKFYPSHLFVFTLFVYAGRTLKSWARRFAPRYTWSSPFFFPWFTIP